MFQFALIHFKKKNQTNLEVFYYFKQILLSKSETRLFLEIVCIKSH